MSTSLPPKAFISHATEDKARFVTGFATALRSGGIEAWYDQWEIKPGDSLVQKIFDEGIKNADAFIIILSANSVAKKWVREELGSGVVAKIDRACQLIPVVIDDCEVPTPLKHLKWVKIKDLDNYKMELSEIVNAIFKISAKPPLGPAPAHSKASVSNYLPGLTKADNLVFGIFCHRYLEKGDKHIQPSEVLTELDALEIGDEAISESLEILARHGFVKLKFAAGMVWLVELYTSALDRFMLLEFPDYETILRKIIANIVNEGRDTASGLQKSTGYPMPVILHVVDLLELKGLFQTARAAGIQDCKIFNVSAALKRVLR